MEWTPDQEKAINEDGSDILVSAAAGSGKTAVLVERIIQKLLNGDVNIDELLVVTFTEAAAAEMKEKIINRIKKSDHPQKRRQLRLAGSADITTIDAFCNRCVKNNFHVLGIDPGFNINTDDIELLREETAIKLFDSLYDMEECDEKREFYHLLSLYASNRSDYGLMKLVLNIYKFIQTFAEPMEWLDEKADMYDLSGDKFYSSVWINGALNNMEKTAKKQALKFHMLLEKTAYCITGAKSDYKSILSLYPVENGVSHIDEVWDELWNAIIYAARFSEEFYNAAKESGGRERWERLLKLYASRTFIQPDGRRGDVRGNDLWKEQSLEYKALKDELLSELDAVFFIGEQEIRLRFSQMNTAIHELVGLIKRFDEVYKAEKEKRNVLEFSDIEHLTYELFKNPDIKREYTNRYKEILIDEYQDTNGLQDAIFRSISKDNIFMVGDLKQSIYRFRGGDPYIFKDKSARFSKSDGGKRIALSQNFRSRREILDSVNAVFGCVMSDTVGDVVYEGDEKLSREKDYYTENGCSHKSELHLLPVIKQGDGDAEIDLMRTEARHIAGEIQSLISSRYQIMDKEKSADAPVYRDIKYSDITILSNSTSSIADVFTEELESAGVPVFVESKGYFDKREVRLMLSLIKLISNNRSDISLISVMRSPIGDFSDDELAKIRLNHMRTDCFYDAVKCYEGEDRLKRKCGDFISKLDRWREYMKYKSVAKLIWTLYEETGFYDFIGALEGGLGAQANLKLLYERAKKFEKSGFKGIFNFIRYIERLENQDGDIAGAKLVGENHDVVRIMTIHKSKGLEFPVVFLCGAAKRFSFSNAKTESAHIHLHKDLGFGMRYINAEYSFYDETAAKSLIDRKNRAEALSECLRKLYVAVTRPKEKLIVTASFKTSSEQNFGACITEWEQSAQGGIMDEETSAEAKTFADWLIPAALSHKGEWETKVFFESVSDESDIAHILEYKYPYAESCGLPSKTTVTEIKKNENEQKSFSVNYSMTKLPSFMDKREAAAEIGTAHHSIMENIIPADNMGLEYIKGETERILAQGELMAEDMGNINYEFIKKFFNSDMGKRMIKAYKKGVLHRETPFEIAIPLSRYSPSFEDKKEYEGDEIILQGVIDCWFEEEDGIVLMDYKTDHFRGDIENKDDIEAFETEKIEQYRVQLELYADAIEKILKKSVKQKFLYLFSAESVVECK